MNTKREWWRRNTAGIALWAVLALLLVAIVLFKAIPKRVEAVPPPPEKAVAVKTVVVSPRDVFDEVRLPGRIAAFVDARVPARKGAAVAAILAERGDEVAAGQVLLRLEDGTWRTMREQAEIELRDAVRDLERWHEMRKAGAVSQSEYDAVARRLALASNAVAQAQVQIEQCLVKAPVDGRVEERYVEPGEFVNEGEPAFRVVDTSRVKVSIDVPERDITAVRAGETMRFDVPASGAIGFTGVVSFVSAAARPDGASFAVELLIDPAPAVLKPGMIADVRLVRGLVPSAVTVPLSAVVPQRGENVVYLVVEGRAVRRIVRIDRFLATEVVIAAGLAAGERVVLEGQRGLQDGMAVAIDGPDSADAETARP